MRIRKLVLSSTVKKFIEAEHEKYEIENDVQCNYVPFCFVAEIGDQIVGAISGATFFSEVYIDELIVKKEYRNTKVGKILLKKAVENHVKNLFNKSILFAISINNLKMEKSCTRYFSLRKEDASYEIIMSELQC